MDRRQFTCAITTAALTGSVGMLARPDRAPAATRTSGVKAVLELFTSQGCSSCPAADALFENYTRRPDLLALTLPVDYWDYLGWKDTLASHKFTKRQRIYARHRGDGQIYTPQLVMNGVAHTNGADGKGIETLLAKSLDGSSRWTDVTVGIDNGHVVANIGASRDDGKIEAMIWVASVSRRVDVQIKRGENAGKTLSYFNVVRDVHSVGTWTGNTMAVRVAREALSQKGEDCCAIVIQPGIAGPILGAAFLPHL